VDILLLFLPVTEPGQFICAGRFSLRSQFLFEPGNMLLAGFLVPLHATIRANGRVHGTAERSERGTIQTGFQYAVEPATGFIERGTGDLVIEPLSNRLFATLGCEFGS